MRRATVLLIEPSCLLAVVVAVVAVEVASFQPNLGNPGNRARILPTSLKGQGRLGTRLGPAMQIIYLN